MIKNAKIVCYDCPPDRYNPEDQQRGSPKFTVRSHVLGEILRNAQRWVRGYDSPESKAKKFGELLDCHLLTPKQWPMRYCVLPEDAPRRPTKAQRNAKKPSPETTAAIAWWDKFEAENPGEEVSSDLCASIHAAADRLKEDEQICELLRASLKQLMITAEWESQSGLVVPIKALIDIAPSANHPTFSNSLWDLKTTTNASPRNFAMDAQKYNYAMQGALYLDLFNAATGEQRSDFGHVVIENYAPYEFRSPPPLLSQRFLQYGRMQYQRALLIYCTALTTGKWPGYDQPSAGWPITDCADWFLDMETLYPEMPAEENAPEDNGTVADVLV